MTKQELIENYTMKQLADMVIKYQNASEVKNDEIQKLKWDIGNLKESNGRLQSRLDTYNNFLLPRCTKEAKEMIGHNHFAGVRIVTCEQWNNREKQTMNISDFRKCQDEYEKFLKESPFQSEIEKIARDIREREDNVMAMEFTRVICDLLKENGVFVHCTKNKFMEEVTKNSIKERYGVIFDKMDFSEHDKSFTEEIKKLKEQLRCSEEENKKLKQEIYDMEIKIEEEYKPLEVYADRFENNEKELSEENQKLHLQIDKIKIENNKSIADFPPTEPIKVADMLINVKINPTEIDKDGTELVYKQRNFNMSELRQIAEHLLVYCNANEIIKAEENK